MKIIFSLQGADVLLSFSLIAPEVLEEFGTIFTTPLKTQNFAITTSGPDEILKILPFVDSGVLKGLAFYNIHEIAGEIWDFEEIVDLEQWKTSERLDLVYFFVHLPIHHFFHFSNANIRLLELSADDIFQLKEHYLRHKNFKFVHVECKTLSNESDLLSLLGAHFIAEEPQNRDQRKWFFEFPADSESVLYILISDPKNVYFTRIERDRVPNGALIQ